MIAMSWPHVMSVVPVRISASENTVSVKRGRIEDVRLAAVLVPADQFLGGEPDGDHQELQVEPVRPEPEEQVGAEDDRERSEPERVACRVATS